jgi:sterol desaturase/sphingolipid hydroxylase (fatty acid hydroxylase superfamily)
MGITQHISAFVADLLRACVWLALLLIVFVPLERVFAHRRQQVLRRSFRADLFYYFLNSVAPKLLLIAPLTALAAGLHRLLPSEFYELVAATPGWLRICAALVANEVGGYWGHRWSHEIPYLWGFHAIHHSAEEIDWLVTAKAHPIDIFFTHFCALVPLYLLGFAQPRGTGVDLMPMAVTAAGTFWGYFVHANVNWRLGWLEALISTPAFHHWHHTNDNPQVLDKNYSAMLPWVDRCFGTYYLPEQWPEKYGTDTQLAPDVIGQLLDPLSGPPRAAAMPHAVDVNPAAQ